MSQHLSRFLAKVLRHEARNKGLDVTPDGYVNVEEILELSEIRSNNYTKEDVRRIVQNDSKGRFKLRTTRSSVLQIKATQGHSMQLNSAADPDLAPINHKTEVRAVLHGTRILHWESIKKKGLSKMNRKDIHFAQGERGQKSGFPPYCDMVIEINLEKALKDGIKFYKSENDVILSPGNSFGCIPKEYFQRAYELRGDRKSLSLD